MKKVLSVFLLITMLVTMVALPASAENVSPAGIPQSSRNDVLVLFDGSTDNLKLQHPTLNHVEFYEDDQNYIQGNSSLFVDMPTTEDCNISFIGNFALMLWVSNEEPVSIEDYPISELSFYNHNDTRSGDQIQINYVDNENGHGSADSYNKSITLGELEPGWHHLTHNIPSTALWNDLDPDDIGGVRISWLTMKDADNNVDYQEIDWSFDCLLIAKQSFFDDRAVAEAEMIGIIDALKTPTKENIDTVKADIQAAKEKLDDYLDEFPNFLIESTDTITKMNEIWLAYQTVQAQAAADGIIAKIDALGDITLENHIEKAAEIEAIDADIQAYTDAGYSKKLITNMDVLDGHKAIIERCRVEADIDALPEANAVAAEDIEKINGVKAALTALSGEQQALIPQAKRDKLTALTAKITENKINALPTPEALTLEDEESLNTVKSELEALSEAEKALVGEEAIAKLTALQAKLEDLKKPYSLGKVDDDDDINAADALLALQHSVKLITLKDNAFKAADVSGDGTVDASDALLILQCSVKLITPDDFPAAKK